jgi:hypothetical protein
MDETHLETLLNFFKVLANENRLKILGILSTRECSVEELAVLLSVKEPTISHHLNHLKSLNLVDMRVIGNDHLYRLNAKVLQSMNKEVFVEEKLPSLAEDVDYSAYERKVFSTFLDGEQIKAIPSGYKKRLVIYKWLADKFEYDKQYQEVEVNTIISQYHPDYASFRRDLVDLGFIARKRGVYWRTEWQNPRL